MAQRRLTELDFDGIKNNLKLFLASQSEFSDYDFEASGLSVLIDLLAYHGHYNAIMAHTTANEAFLDSAIKRNSIASIAKTMGYTARSARSARTTINLVVIPDPTYSSSAFTLSRSKIFTTALNGRNYNFYPIKDYTVTKEERSGVSAFYFDNIELAEGLRVENSQIIETGGEQGPVLMANPGVDTTTVRCRIQTSVTNTSLVTHSFSDNILDVNNLSTVFFIEEALNGFYEVIFGDGVIGKKLTIGNVVKLDYIATNGSAGNGATAYTAPTNLTGTNETVTLTVVSNSAGGSEQETVDSIRFNAPRFNATKNRAVTANDYKSLILTSNSNVKSVSVWGGEDNDPPIYGKVFISLQPKEGLIISQDDKDAIVRDFIEPRQPVSIQSEFVDPEFTFIGLKTTVQYDAKKTTLTAGAIENAVAATIENFFNNNLNTLDANFFYSKLTADIVKSSASIVAVNLELRLQKRFTPTTGNESKYSLQFNNKINPLSITSNFFDATINNATYKVYVADVPDADVIAPEYSGSGTLILKTSDKNIVVDANAGTIDYDTGKIILNNLNVSSISGTNVTQVNINAQPHESAKDIKTSILTRTTEESSSAVIPTPSKNIILAQDASAEDTPNNIAKGIAISAIPNVSDY